MSVEMRSMSVYTHSGPIAARQNRPKNRGRFSTRRQACEYPDDKKPAHGGLSVEGEPNPLVLVQYCAAIHPLSRQATWTFIKTRSLDQVGLLANAHDEIVTTEIANPDARAGKRASGRLKGKAINISRTQESKSPAPSEFPAAPAAFRRSAATWQCRATKQNYPPAQ